MDPEEIAAREAIRDLVARYNACGDSGRIDEVIELFASDAHLSVDEHTYRGVDEIRTMFEAAATETRSQPGSYVRHFVATHQIDWLDSGHARGRCYFQVITDAGLDHWGRYLDEYRCPDGRWRFASRRVEVDGRVPGGWSDRSEARLRERR
jgi:hypothetical protein